MSQKPVSLKRIPFNYQEERQISGLAFWLRFVAVISLMIGILQLVLENPLMAFIQFIGAWLLWNAAKKFIRIKSPVKVEDGDKWVQFKPFNGFKVDFNIEFDHPAFKNDYQKAEVDFSTTSFVKEISLNQRKIPAECIWFFKHERP